MQLDIGEVRFLTKVAHKSPRGLRLLLFKEKSSGNEKLVFIVKTASEDIDKLALSRMTWQAEQSKNAPRIVIVRLLILPEGSNEFFQSESGLIMNDDKDRRSLGALARQKSIEIFFFNYESEFHSKIELLTTYNMGIAAQALLDLNPIIDEGKLIVKSESFSEADIKNAITGKVKESKLKDKDLIDSIQKKMPVVSSSIPKTKPAEDSKISIKSNDIAVSGTYGTPTANKPFKNNELNLKEVGRTIPPGKITPDELMKSIPPGKITPDELMKSIPPGKITPDELMKSIPPGKITPDELMKSIPPGKITSDELMKSIPPSNLQAKDIFSDTLTKTSLSAEDLLKAVNSTPSANISSEDLLKSIPPDVLTTEELLKSLSSTIPSESGIKAQDLLKSITSFDSLEQDSNTLLDNKNLSDSIKNDKSFFIEKSITGKINNHVATKEFKRDELLDSLKSEPSHLRLEHEEEIKPVSNLISDSPTLKLTEEEIKPAINLMAKPPLVKPTEEQKLGSNLMAKPTLIKPTEEEKNFFSDLMSESTPLKSEEEIKHASEIISEPPKPKLTEEELKLFSDLMSEPTPLKSNEGTKSELMKSMESNIKDTVLTSKPIPSRDKKEEIPSINEADLLRILSGDI